MNIFVFTIKRQCLLIFAFFDIRARMLQFPGCSKACNDCDKCLYGGPFVLICFPICVLANCEGGFGDEWNCCNGEMDKCK